MAAARTGYRGNAIGISAGLGIALPLAAYAATLPFDNVNDVVRADAMPFAVGIVAGVGMLALTGHLLDAHADRVAEEEAEAARFASIYGGKAACDLGKDGSPRPTSTHGGKRFSGSGTPSGVPVISRAVDALDEMEAWAEIDAMFSEDSPISCDPTRSKDMYQIALEELLKSERPAQSQAASGATPGAPSRAAAYAGVPGTATCGAASPAQAASGGYEGDLDEVDARNDAMASLYGDAAVSRSYAPVMPTIATAGPSESAAVPVADYSGHEGMWAAALAILDEADEAPIAPACGKVDAGSGMDARRKAAIAEGETATRVHSHVNSLIEEEFDRVPSKSVHATTHDYLKVIEGGTASMPALQSAEA